MNDERNSTSLERLRVVDFANANEVGDWTPIDDVVMGGRSWSALTPSGSGTAIFAGRVSRENGGGFASVHSPSLGSLGARSRWSMRSRHPCSCGSRRRVPKSEEAERQPDSRGAFVCTFQWIEIFMPHDGHVLSPRGHSLEAPQLGQANRTARAARSGDAAEARSG